MHSSTKKLITVPLDTPLSEIVEFFDDEENERLEFKSSWRDRETGALVMLFTA